MLIGFNWESMAATIHWVDTWHNGTRVMPLVGTFDPKGTLVARGTFPAGPEPDWGWRIEIRKEGEQLKIDMFCVEPEAGKDVGWVWSEYRL